MAIGTYKKFVGMTAPQDFINELKKDVEKINQIIHDSSKPMEEVGSMVNEVGMKKMSYM